MVLTVRGELGAGAEQRLHRKSRGLVPVFSTGLTELAEKWEGQGGKEAGGFLSPAGRAGKRAQLVVRESGLGCVQLSFPLGDY